MKKKYDIAAYVWPAFTGDEPRSQMFWTEGIGEWQTVKNAHTLGKKIDLRKPLWGYVNEADPFVMEAEIKAATSHGLNVFIYDWYWYDNRPFLENCLNNGFLKARNRDKMKFYLMWANHDANATWDIRLSDKSSVPIWQGAVNAQQFRTIGKRWLEKYFCLDCYYKIDGKPVISIYDLKNFVEGLGSLKDAKREMDWLENETVKLGLGGIHYQFIKWGKHFLNFSGVDGGIKATPEEHIKALGFSSMTHYQFVHFADMNRPYSEIIPDVMTEWESIDKNYDIPYFPHVSVGWDNNMRYKSFRDCITTDNPPDMFEKMLLRAKEYSDTHNKVPLITINSWNEWTEKSYLEPDDIYSYGYLSAIKNVFGAIPH